MFGVRRETACIRAKRMREADKRLRLVFPKKIRAKLDESLRCIGRCKGMQKGTVRVAEACEVHKGAYVLPSVIRLGEFDQVYAPSDVLHDF